MGITFQVEDITPDRAKSDLEKSFGENFRPLDGKRSEIMAEAMVNGRFDLNGETVKYNCDGRLIDGQHRYYAVVLAGVAVPMLVVRGVVSDMNIDTGISRRLENYLAKNGEKHPKVLAGALSWIWKKRLPSWGSGLSQKIPNSELIAILASTPLIRQAVEFVTSNIPQEVGSHAMFSAMTLSFQEKDAILADWFIRKLGSGTELKEEDPVRWLREILIFNMKSKREKLLTSQKCAMSIKAWNMTRRGAPCKILRFRAVGPAPEAFPEIE